MRWMAGFLLLGLAGCSDRPELSVPGPHSTSTEAEAVPSAPVVLVAPAPPAAKVVLDVMQVVGKSESEVAVLLGPPDACEDIHRARMCRYLPDGNEVMFAAGKADMITVQGMAAVPFNEQALAALGLAPASPDHFGHDDIRWESLPGLEEVSVFPGPAGTVHYAYVKVGKH